MNYTHFMFFNGTGSIMFGEMLYSVGALERYSHICVFK